MHGMSHDIRILEGLVPGGMETKRDLVVCPGQQALPPLCPLIGWLSLVLETQLGCSQGVALTLSTFKLGLIPQDNSRCVGCLFLLLFFCLLLLFYYTHCSSGGVVQDLMMSVGLVGHR